MIDIEKLKLKQRRRTRWLGLVTILFGVGVAYLLYSPEAPYYCAPVAILFTVIGLRDIIRP